MTGTHVSEELPRLLSGEATRAEVLTAAPHLRTCVDCQQELVSAVVAHAALESARRFAPEILAHGADDLIAAGTSVFSAGGTAPDETLPDLSSLFAQVRREAATEPEPARSKRRTVRLAAAAAVLGAAVGAGGYAAGTQLSGPSESGRVIALAAYDTGRHAASARLSNSALSVDASSLPRLDAGHRYEIWLTNEARTQMQPVGWIGTDGKARLTVPRDLVERFQAIEVSVQQVGAVTYDYSGTSVLRGSYG